MSARAERRHPEKVAVDPAECVTPSKKPSNAEFAARARMGGLAVAASLTEEQMREKMRRVRAARTAKENARRAEAGLPPIAPKAPLLDGDEAAFWLAQVDERYPDRVFENKMQRRRLAEKLARMEAARLAADAFRQRGTEGTR